MTHSIEVSLTPALYPMRTTPHPHTTVVVDILRATSVVCAAFASGVQSIVPLDSLADLSSFRKKGYILAAERNGEKIGDAELGNSPTEYMGRDLHGCRLAYSTTNGTVSILRATDAERTLIGCFSNISALIATLTSTPQNLVILCSGWKQDFSLEDTLFAGELASRLLDGGLYETHNDATLMAIELFHQAGNDLYNYCRNASHVIRLQRLGADKDILFALQRDTCPYVPYLDQNKVLTI